MIFSFINFNFSTEIYYLKQDVAKIVLGVHAYTGHRQYSHVHAVKLLQ